MKIEDQFINEIEESLSKATTNYKKNVDPNDCPIMTGWVCPVCGAGLSPFTDRCPCKPIEYKIT